VFATFVSATELMESLQIMRQIGQVSLSNDG
jgi:hypothetical protein